MEMSTQTSERQKGTHKSRPRFYLFRGNKATYERMTLVHSLQSAACHCAFGTICAIQSPTHPVDWATSAISSLFAAGRSIRRFPSLWLDQLFKIKDRSRRRRHIVMWWMDIATEWAQVRSSGHGLAYAIDPFTILWLWKIIIDLRSLSEFRCQSINSNARKIESLDFDRAWKSKRRT